MSPNPEPLWVRAALALLSATAWRIPPRTRQRLGRLKTFRSFGNWVFSTLGQRVVDDRKHRVRMVVDLRDFDQRAHFRRPHVEEHVIRYLCAHTRPGDIAVDVGAFCGYYATLMASLVGAKGRVIAVEPAPAHAERVRRQIALNGLSNVTVVEAAVSGTVGAQRLAARGPASHLTAESEDGLDVATITLDSLYENDPDREWIIKLDVEGAEIDALEGMKRLLGSGRARAVIEVNDDEISEAVRVLGSQLGLEVRTIGASFHGRHLALEPRIDGQV